MKNGSEYVLEWTIHAQCELDAMYDYSERNRSVYEITRFSKLLDKKLSIIHKFPFIYPAYEGNKSVRRCVISKQVSLYYKITTNKIIILSLFDNRQSPDKLTTVTEL
jgi:plasmid stabilization system protein ParE